MLSHNQIAAGLKWFAAIALPIFFAIARRRSLWAILKRIGDYEELQKVHRILERPEILFTEGMV